MDSSIKGIVRKFIDELNELQDEQLDRQSIDKLGFRVDEFEDKSKSISLHMRTIISYLYNRVSYKKSINS